MPEYYSERIGRAKKVQRRDSGLDTTMQRSIIPQTMDAHGLEKPHCSCRSSPWSAVNARLSVRAEAEMSLKED